MKKLKMSPPQAAMLAAAVDGYFIINQDGPQMVTARALARKGAVELTWTPKGGVLVSPKPYGREEIDRRAALESQRDARP